MKYIKTYEKIYDSVFFERYTIVDNNIKSKSYIFNDISILVKNNIDYYIYYVYLDNIFDIYIFAITKTNDETEKMNKYLRSFTKGSYGDFLMINRSWKKLNKNDIESTFNLYSSGSKFNI